MPSVAIRPIRRAHRWAAGLSLLLALGGCGALPSSGPEERDILQSERSKANQLGFRIVDVDARTTSILANAHDNVFEPLSGLTQAGVSDRIGPGDVLSISVFEIGSGLFSSNGQNSSQSGAAGVSTSATRENLPPMEVGPDGTIDFPYIGHIRATGRTAAALQDDIVARLRAHSQDPQAVVEVSHNIANTVVVSGEVHKPGRVPLTLTGERLTDVIALAGGTTHPPQDMMVDLIRRGRTVAAPLEQVQEDFSLDVPVQPLDRVQLIYQPRSFTLFGATKVAEMPFTAAHVSLAESIARAGGPLDERADPNAVFLFRFESPAVARDVGVHNIVPPGAVAGAAPRDLPIAGLSAAAASGGATPVPVIYHLDMMNTDSYFLAQHIPIHDKDVIYIANARASQLGKFIGLLSGLFTPALVARTIQQ